MVQVLALLLGTQWRSSFPEAAVIRKERGVYGPTVLPSPLSFCVPREGADWTQPNHTDGGFKVMARDRSC